MIRLEAVRRLQVLLHTPEGIMKGKPMGILNNTYSNRPFPSRPKPVFQSEVKYKAIDMKISFYPHANETHFHKKGFALGLVLKERAFVARKWPITTIIYTAVFFSYCTVTVQLHP